MTRARGFTLIELMVAVGLAGVTSAFLLMITRSQMLTYNLNDQVTKAQQNGRAAINLTEQLLRRACGGMSIGTLALDVPGQPTQLTQCIRVFDGAIPSGGTFTAGSPGAAPDAIEVVYGTTPLTVTTAAPSLVGAPSVQVTDVTGFAPGDLVLLTDFAQADLLQIDTIALGTAPAGTLNLKAPGGALLTPTAPVVLDLTKPNVNVLKAQSFSLYVSQGMLMYDPDGLAGTSHADAEPLAEGVEDLQLAVGFDNNGDGVITENVASPGGDEWLGNGPNELPLPPTPWDRAGTTDPQLRSIRATLLVRTTNVYQGDTQAIGPYEDRTVYPPTTGGTPRYRALRIVVSPRVATLN